MKQAHGGQRLKKRVGTLLPHAVKFHGRRVVHFGTNNTCVLCGSRVRSYLDTGGISPVLDDLQVVGGMMREADRCPVCLGLDRTRLQMHYLDTELHAARADLRVLHFAPELGLYLYLQDLPGIDYVMGDLEPHRYDFSRSVVQCDITKLPFAENSFDVAIASHVLEHVPADVQALSELARVLAPGGVALLMTPISLVLEATREDHAVTSEADRLRMFGQRDHVRIYGADFTDRIAAGGLEVTEFRVKDLDLATVRGLKLNPLETLYAAAKPG